MKVNLAMRWLIAGALVLFILFWALTSSGCTDATPRDGNAARDRCNEFCEDAEMVLVELRTTPGVISWVNVMCICAEVDRD